MKNGYVYLIRQGQSDLYKIGHTTKKPSNRLKELQTGNPQELYLITSYQTKYYKDVENLMHTKNNHFKVVREWFRFDFKIESNFLEECQNNEAGAKFLYEKKDLDKKMASLIQGRI
jgi:hypothetical protein